MWSIARQTSKIRLWYIATIVSVLLPLRSTSALTLEFVPIFDGAPLRADSLRYATSDRQQISVERLAFLLSGFGAQRSDGSWHRFTEDTVAFLEFSPPSLAVTLPALPEGDYIGLQFSVGLPEAINHSDPAQYASDHPLNPTRNALHWTWAEGYIFLAIEGKYRHSESASAEVGGYALHMGNDWARTPVTLPVEYRHSSQLLIPLDVGQLFRFPQAIDLVEHGHTTHSRSADDELASRLRANLAGIFGMPKLLGDLGRQAKAAQPLVEPLFLPEKPRGYPFSLKRHFPRPDLPRDNPLLISRVALGKELFFDPLLSADGSVSCSSCHEPEYAFGDRRVFSKGIGGQAGSRHSMPLFNLAWRSEFFWDGRAPSLREQVLDPITDPKELGNASVESLADRLRADPRYRDLFAAAFGAAEIDGQTISLALENFLLSLTSQDSKFDRAMRGQAELSSQERRGFELFFTEYEPRMGQYGADCFHCHGGALFSDQRFRNNGLELRDADYGREHATDRSEDRGKFLVPSLRNVAITAPYMHDGRFDTLQEVIDHYRTGIVRSDTLDANLAKHPAPGIPISDEDAAALIAFLQTLTDPQYSRSHNP